VPETEPRFALCADATQLLSRWKPADRAQQVVRDGFVNMLALNGHAAFDAGQLPGHVTVSMVVLDWELRRALLVQHPVAGWLQPGGHVRSDDATLREAVTRKTQHEAGIELTFVSPWPIQADVHPILCAGQWALHWDVRFAGKASREARPSLPAATTLRDVQWFDQSEAVRHAPGRIPLIHAARRRLQQHADHLPRLA
jgi:ADP-ribose pyrophosphatase YjhB (NUDIX family)